MKKRQINLLIILVMVLTIIITPVAYAEEETDQHARISSKTEIIYALLNSQGGLKNIFAVNEFDVEREGIIRDFGAYDSIMNLSDTGKIAIEDSIITAYAKEGKFYYRGNTSTLQLPWLFTVEYFLDGSSIEATELAGKNGNLTIEIDTAQNKQVKSEYFDNYLLQISLSLDSGKCKDIIASDGIIASAGSSKMITFTTMPGEIGSFTINSTVENFEMSGIEFAAIPFNMSFDMPDTDEMTDGLLELSDGIADIYSGARSLNNGSGDIQSGLKSLTNGGNDMKVGLQALDNGSGDIKAGSTQILQALNAINAGIQGSDGSIDLSALAELPANLRVLANALQDIHDGLDGLSSGFSQSYAALSAAIGNIPSSGISSEKLDALIATNPESAALQTLIAYYLAASEVQATYNAVSAALDAVDTNLPVLATGLEDVISGLSTMADEIETALANSDSLNAMIELKAGLGALASQYGAFHAGLSEYFVGISAAVVGYSDFNDGIGALYSNYITFDNGVGDLKEGLGTLNREAATIPEQIEEEIDKLTADYDKSNYKPSSFTSSLNKNTDLVQFVIRSASIEIDEEKIMLKEIEQDSGFLDRLADLFR